MLTIGNWNEDDLLRVPKGCLSPAMVGSSFCTCQLHVEELKDSLYRCYCR